MTPFEKHEVEEYERKRYRGIDQRIVHGRERKILRKILRIIGGSNLRVLDIPCGYGRFSKLLLDKDIFLVGSDLSFFMVKRAKEMSFTPNGSLGVVADAKLGLPFKKDVFDIILCMRFFHHVHEEEERESILKEFSWVTAEWVILSYYQMNSLHFIQRILRRTVKKSRTRIKMISRRELFQVVKASGFRVVKIFPLFRGLHAHHIALLEKVKTLS
ncbi:MAG: methyltransferase domain-containing protein [Candidatus Aminicenantes bacterium]|nr:methyltransferase domain-containing protein [Candidatus Aminicenantes bacterium]